MTKIKIFKKNDIFVGFEISGHSGYSQAGKDIICASISSISQSCALGLKKVLGINISMKVDEDKGFLKVELPNNINNEDLEKSQILLDTMYISIEDLLSGYSKYISMEVIENVY
ncbi:MAG: ribosomal-processing cysteine protease Prp [Clostridiales bacterium]|nr:ribosomal-processing cysteine protease Prp [Clostridiales bacterium]